MSRPEQPEPFLRGCAFDAVPGIPYPRARSEAPLSRLPMDTWVAAAFPATVRLELVGDAEQIAIEYETASGPPGFADAVEVVRALRSKMARSFEAWRGDRLVGAAEAVPEGGLVELAVGRGDERCTVYLPELLLPLVRRIEGIGGRIEPAPPGPRWVAYGDSILEGWVATTAARAWPAIAARRHGLDVVNLGYAGAARGEIVSAQHVASLPADVLSITHGTNCWNRVPHSTAHFGAKLEAFLDLLRAAHPTTPLVAASPVLRPDAEETRNPLGATLADLRRVFEEVVQRRIDVGDAALALVPGAAIIGPHQLADGVHPDDAGHDAIARALGPVLASAPEMGKVFTS